MAEPRGCLSLSLSLSLAMENDGCDLNVAICISHCDLTYTGLSLSHCDLTYTGLSLSLSLSLAMESYG